MESLKKVIHGSHEFEGVLDVTDPCYDKDVWCRMSVPVKKGLYSCITWESKDSINESVTRVRIIGIYKDGIIPNEKQMKRIGEIGVDAGLAGFFMNKPDYSQEEWSDFCKSIETGKAWNRKVGFFSVSGDGDGGYPVYAYKKDGEIVALEIRF